MLYKKENKKNVKELLEHRGALRKEAAASIVKVIMSLSSCVYVVRILCLISIRLVQGRQLCSIRNKKTRAFVF